MAYSAGFAPVQAPLFPDVVPDVKRYGTILLDPPWPEKGGGKIKRGADRHYNLMTVGDIAALPVPSLALPDSHLYMWVTNNYLEDAFSVVAAWNELLPRRLHYHYVTVITWVKMANGRPQWGLGQYYRGATEQLLFFRRGQPPYKIDPLTGKRGQGRTAIIAPRRQHSEKPDEQYPMIESVSEGPYCELFARQKRCGWDCYGDEIDGRSIRDTLRHICGI
jgi:N6-adenosine-specific RNA methylase IME4